MSPKMGRPTENPKPYKITVRLDEQAESTLNTYCEQEGIERGEAVRRGIKKLEADIKK